MSYQSQTALAEDPDFQARVRGCCIQQAGSFINDARPSWVSLAKAILRQDPEETTTFFWISAAGPGIADKVSTPEGIDQSLVTDADLLSLTQTNWPIVAELYFNEDGTPIGG
jgi:hypothetical protein